MTAKNLGHGALAGVAGGVPFGAMMGMMGMLPMIGKMMGYPSAAAGFLVHLAISAIIGAGFAALFGDRASGVTSGLARGLGYGGAWWLLGPLTLMPLMMGMGLRANWNAAAAQGMLPSLAGHLLFGIVLGLAYTWLRSRTPTARTVRLGHANVASNA